MARFLGRAVRVVADGFYAKRPFLKPAAAAGVTVISRLRKDAGLRTVPRPPRGRRRPGRPAVDGSGRISLAKRAGQRRGWRTVPARQYGPVREKHVQTFEATMTEAQARTHLDAMAVLRETVDLTFKEVRRRLLANVPTNEYEIQQFMVVLRHKATSPDNIRIAVGD